MVTMSTIRRRVNRGVTFLNNHVPGWLDRVSPNSLDISRNNHCILGQLFGDYCNGADKLGIGTFNRKETNKRVSLGFTAGPYFSQTCDALTNVWQNKIRKLRAAK